YFPQRNRFTVLVETHSWKDYATRVRVTRNTIIALAQLLAQHGARWRAQTREADDRALRLGNSEVVLDYSAGWREPSADKADVAATDAALIDFRGYAYSREVSPISGELITVYDPKRPEIWRVPFRQRVSPSLIVKAPLGGYVVPAEWATDIGVRLAAHGVQVG